MSASETDEQGDLTLAIRTAKTYLDEVLQGEDVSNVGVEEVRPPDHDRIWRITLGFDRRRPRFPTFHETTWVANNFLQAAAVAAARPQRVFKVIDVDASVPKALSMTNWKDD